MPSIWPSGGAGGAGPLTWVPLTLGSGITAYVTSPYGTTPAAALSNGLVYLKGLITGTAGPGSTVATLPSAGMFPPFNRPLIGMNANDGTVGSLSVKPDGTITNVNNWASFIQSLDGVYFAV